MALWWILIEWSKCRNSLDVNRGSIYANKLQIIVKMYFFKNKHNITRKLVFCSRKEFYYTVKETVKLKGAFSSCHKQPPFKLCKHCIIKGNEKMRHNNNIIFTTYTMYTINCHLSNFIWAGQVSSDLLFFDFLNFDMPRLDLSLHQHFFLLRLTVSFSIYNYEVSENNLKIDFNLCASFLYLLTFT